MMYIGTMTFEDNVLTLTADSLIRPKLKSDTRIVSLKSTTDGKEAEFDTAGHRLSPDAVMREKGVRIRRGKNGRTTKALIY